MRLAGKVMVYVLLTLCLVLMWSAMYQWHVVEGR